MHTLLLLSGDLPCKSHSHKKACLIKPSYKKHQKEAVERRIYFFYIE